MYKIINNVKKIISLIFGLFLFSIGILLTVHANIGAAPWDTFQLGLAGRTGLTFGQVSQIVGLAIIIINIALKEIPGWGTIANMYFIGLFLDILESHSLIPQASGWISGIIMMIVGTMVIGWGTFFYMNAGLGAGPRDGLMLGLARVLSTEVWKARTAIESAVLIGGMLLGRYPGVGTLAFAVLVGPSVELAYRIGKKDPKAVQHRTLLDDYKFLKGSKEKSQTVR